MKKPDDPLQVDVASLRGGRPPALLLGGLDLLPPLGFAGIPAIVASPDPGEPAFASRYCTGRCLLPPIRNRNAAAERLMSVGARLVAAVGCRIPLFYGDDDYLNLLDEHRDEFARHFLLLLNDAETSRSLLEKDRFEALARARGIAVPRTLAWGENGPGMLGGAAGPVLVKPKVKINWEDSPVFLRLLGGQGKARVFASGHEVMNHPLAAQLKDQLTFQEYVRGDDRHLWSFHGFADQRGELLASFSGHKLRTYPALTGLSTYLELVHDEAFAAIGRDVAARLQLKGIFKIDFKKDAIDGRFRVLEVNARYNLWHHLAARNGLNLPRVAYDYLLHGERPHREEYRTDYRWLYLRLDYRAYRELESRGEITTVRWLWSLLTTRNVYHLFSWSDPMPFAVRCRDRVRSWLRRGLCYLRLRLRQWLSTAS